jgi:peptide/nickel transport system substrate-binding protein
MEALRDAWYDAADLPTQQRLGREMQVLALEEVPFVPTGMWRSPIARRSSVTGVLRASRPLFWNLRKG